MLTVKEMWDNGIHPVDYYAERLGKLTKQYHRGLIGEKEYRKLVREVTKAMITYHDNVNMAK